MHRMNNVKCMYAALCFFVVVALCGVIQAQETGKIRGVVSDAATGEVLIGANVFFPDLNMGSSTDIDGEYLITLIPVGTYKVIARYVGYQEQAAEVTINKDKTIEHNFELEATAIEMGELIVTGQGSETEKKRLTSTVSTIDVKELQYTPVQSVDQLLQGRVTGLSSFNSSGMPGTGGRISARGIKSTINSGTPVIYVDNVRVDNAEMFRLALDTGGAESTALADLIIGEIDHIEVLKGGAASTIYGSEAANGVIHIFTKKGEPGPPKWTFRYTSGFDQPEERFVSEDYVKDNILQTGAYQGYDISVSGGNQFLTYNVSGKTYQSDGLIYDNQNRARNYSLATGFRVHLSEQSNLEISASYIKNQIKRIYNNNLPFSPFSGFEDGSKGDQLGYTDHDRDSLKAIMKTPDIMDDIDRFRVAVNYDYKPIEAMTNIFTVGIDYRNNESREFVPRKSGFYFGQQGGYVYRADREYLTITLSYNGSYKLPKWGWLEQKLTFGAQGFRVEDRETFASGENFAIPGTEDFDNAAIIDAMESNRQLFNGGFYLVDQIALFDRLFFDAGFRVDGNSAFGSDIGLQFYPKAGVAYMLSDETFYPKGIKQYVSTLKLRAAWGTTGNFPTPFSRDRTYTAQGYLEQSGLSFGNPGNDDIKPEKTTSIDIGFDMGLFNDRASIEFNYYKQNTTDALFVVPEDPTSGFDTQLKNVGEIQNSGIELTFNAEWLHSKNVSISTRFSFSTLENEVVSLGGAAPFGYAFFSFLPRRVEEGYPVGVFRVNVPIADADGNFTGAFEEQLTGTPMPKQFGSFGINISLFQDLSISALAEYAFGHKFVNLKKTLRFFSGVEDVQEVVPDGYTWQTASTVWMEDADWIKVREIAVIYRVPQDFVRGLTMSLQVRNPFVVSAESDNDPELNGFQPSGPNTGGYGYIDISAPRQWRFAVNLSL